MKFSNDQIMEFHDQGYIVMKDVIPRIMVHEALQTINHHIGQNGIPTERLTEFRAQSYCREVQNDLALTSLMNATPVVPLLESLIGEGRVKRHGSAQIALRFPSPPSGSRRPPAGHLDGIGSGNNGTAVGSYTRTFTALAVCLLCDLPEAYMGNFTVWPGSHRTYEDYFREVGHEVLAKGQPVIPLPHEPVHVTGKAGDVVIAHHLLQHTAAPNLSPFIRYAAIFRVNSIDVQDVGTDAYTDIWREWHGVRAVVDSQKKTP
jgi:hypothetical protein